MQVILTPKTVNGALPQKILCIGQKPPGAVVANFQVTIGVNENLSQAERNLVTVAITNNINPNANVVFNDYTPVNANDNATVTDNNLVTATQTGPAVQTLQIISMP